MKNLNSKLLLILNLSWIDQSNVQGQLIGTSGYIIGNNVEIGINNSAHEGAPRFIPSHNRSSQALGSPIYFEFVSNTH